MTRAISVTFDDSAVHHDISIIYNICITSNNIVTLVWNITSASCDTNATWQSLSFNSIQRFKRVYCLF